jgi:hypothetical protein
MPQQNGALSTSPNKETVTLRTASGEMIDALVPGGLSDVDVKSYVRMKRPDLFGPPAGISAPKPTPIQEVDVAGNPQTPEAATAGLPGMTGNRPVQGADLVPGAIAGGGAAAYMGGTATLPFVVAAARRHPLVATMAAQELIHQARQIPAVGRFIPAAAEWLPFLIGPKGAKGEAPAEAERPLSTDQVPGRPYKPNPRYEPAPEPEPLPAREGPLLLKGEVQKPTSMGKIPWIPSLEKAVGNKPYTVKPGVPMREQGLPERESTAVEGFHYDPAQKEFHVKPVGGKDTYTYGDVPPEVAQDFANAESKGKAWQTLRNTPGVVYVKKNGKPVKPVAQPSADPNDLTDILTRSLQAVQPK